MRIGRLDDHTVAPVTLLGLRAIACAALLALLCTPSSNGTAADALNQDSGKVADVLPGGELVLERPIAGTRTVCLSAVEVAGGTAGAAGQRDHVGPAAASKADLTLRELIGRQIILSWKGKDRYGCLLAHVHLDDGRWLQQELVGLGLGRVRTRPDTRSRAQELLVSEEEARRNRRGLWSEGRYRIRDPQSVGAGLHSFQIVEGLVRGAARVRDRIYLNFGRDWRTDFTVSIGKGARQSFDAADLDPLDLEGQTIRVRGWIEDFNGPMIDATHPEQIEVIAPAD